jgi:alanyl aminopeptidase
MQKLLEGEFTASDGLYLVYLIARGEERGAHFRSWLSTHFDELIKRVPPYIAPKIPTLMGIQCNLDDWAEAERFLKPKYDQLDGLSREMDKLRASVQSCVALRDRDLEAVNRYLEARATQR